MEIAQAPRLFRPFGQHWKLTPKCSEKQRRRVRGDSSSMLFFRVGVGWKRGIVISFNDYIYLCAFL